MNRLFSILCGVIMILDVVVVCELAYKGWFAPTVEVSAAYTVKNGDTIWDICNELYIPKDNSETFNEFVYRNSDEHGYLIHSGQSLVITNRLYK